MADMVDRGRVESVSVLALAQNVAADSRGVFCCHNVNGPPLSETKTSNERDARSRMPSASSLPDQLTRETRGARRRRQGSTPLVGGPRSSVLKTAGVSIGSLVSKTMVAWASMARAGRTARLGPDG